MVLATNDRDAIEAEVRGKLDAGMAKKRYIYHSDHSVPPQVSLDTYRFVVDLLDKHGNYDNA
jgi:uroporphyrinogen-III decarboxylase